MKKKGLIFYWANENSPITVTQQIEELSDTNAFELKALNLHDIQIKQASYFLKRLLSFKKIRLSHFDFIIIHNTVSYNINFIESFNKHFSPELSSYQGKIVLFKQDEMLNVNKTKDFILRNNVKLLFTCIPKDEIHKVYPKAEFPNLTFNFMHTGYLKSELISRENLPFEKREIDISYRGMVTPPEWGSLAYEKYYIGEEFQKQIIIGLIKLI